MRGSRRCGKCWPIPTDLEKTKDVRNYWPCPSIPTGLPLHSCARRTRRARRGGRGGTLSSKTMPGNAPETFEIAKKCDKKKGYLQAGGRHRGQVTHAHSTVVRPWLRNRLGKSKNERIFSPCHFYICCLFSPISVSHWGSDWLRYGRVPVKSDNWGQWNNCKIINVFSAQIDNSHAVEASSVEGKSCHRVWSRCRARSSRRP